MVTIACRSATWAQELDLLQPELLERLNAALAAADPDAIGARVSGFASPPTRPPRDDSDSLMRDLQGFRYDPRAFSGGRSWYPYVNLDACPEPPGRPSGGAPAVGVSHDAMRAERTEWQARPGAGGSAKAARSRRRRAKPGTKGRAASDGYSARDITVLEGLEAGPPAPRHVHRLDRPARPPPPRLRGRRQLGRRGDRGLLRPRRRSPSIPTTASPSPTTAAASRSRSTRRRSGRRPRS